MPRLVERLDGAGSQLNFTGTYSSNLIVGGYGSSVTFDILNGGVVTDTTDMGLSFRNETTTPRDNTFNISGTNSRMTGNTIALAGRNRYYIDLFTQLLDEGRRILRLYYSSFQDVLPPQYVAEHEEMIAAIAAGDVEKADRLARGHADQIVRHIQAFVTADARTNADLAI